MKRQLTKAFVFFMVLALCLPSYCYAVEININGQTLVSDTEPVIENSRVFVPVRVIAENLGATVGYNAGDRTIEINKENVHIHIVIGSPEVWFSNEEMAGSIILDTPAFIKNNRTMLPVRVISEIFGMYVDWDDTTKTVFIMENFLCQEPDITEENAGDEVLRRLKLRGLISSDAYFTEVSYLIMTTLENEQEEGYFVSVRKSNPYDDNLSELVGHYFINSAGTILMEYDVVSDAFKPL